MIYDCFTFFNELDLLDIRLNILKEVVDKFVLVEATRTFTNKSKELFYEKNKSRFSAFGDRIIHVVVDDFPTFKTPWHNESHQRNAILRGLMDAQPNDLILIGDIDEIPSPDLVTRHSSDPGISVFKQAYYSYYLNYRNARQRWWYGTKMLSYHDFTHVFDGVKTTYSDLLPQEVNEGTTPSKIRMLTPPRKKAKTRIIPNGGWHFTNLGGAENLLLKMRSFSHQEYNPSGEGIPVSELSGMIERGEGPFWRMRCFAEPLDDTYPLYLRENEARYASLIFPVSDDYIRKHRMQKIWHTSIGSIIVFCERAIPSSLHNFLHMCKVRIRRLRETNRT